MQRRIDRTNRKCGLLLPLLRVVVEMSNDTVTLSQLAVFRRQTKLTLSRPSAGQLIHWAYSLCRALPEGAPANAVALHFDL